MWWRDAVVYQVYPRSFQDSDGDGIGDLPGIERRLDHLTWLGVDALWLSPIYPSPLHDFGYDVTDHAGVDPVFGTLEDFDRLLAAAHARGLRVLLDLVPSHTSVEHPWFRAHPERYVWSDDGPANNWRAAFGGPAWSRDAGTGRWYLHSFYPEQPDLDWRNPDVARAVGDVVRFWLDRGVDGFRVDAIDRLGKDPALADDPPGAHAELTLDEEWERIGDLSSRNHPAVAGPLAALREAAGDAVLVGEAVLPTRELPRYLEHVDLAFCFELLHAPLEAGRLAAVLDEAIRLECRPGSAPAWVFANHDFGRVAGRFGDGCARLVAMLLLTLPGAAFLYQGEEIGMVHGPGAPGEPLDRAGRDPYRHPMQWSPEPLGGFTTGRPWLPLVDPNRRSVEAQRDDPGSLLSFHRRLIGLRRELGSGFELVEGPAGVLAYRRGEHVVALNLGETERPLPLPGEVAVGTDPEVAERGVLPPRTGAVLRADRGMKGRTPG